MIGLIEVVGVVWEVGVDGVVGVWWSEWSKLVNVTPDYYYY